MCDFLFLIEKINKITMMKPRGMGARVSQGRLLLHRLLCWPVGTSTGRGVEWVPQLGRGQRGGRNLTWGCAPWLQQPGPVQPLPTARPWRSQSRPPPPHLPGPPAGNDPGQRQTSARNSSVCLWVRKEQGIRADRSPYVYMPSPGAPLRPTPSARSEPLHLPPHTLDLDDFL